MVQRSGEGTAAKQGANALGPALHIGRQRAIHGGCGNHAGADEGENGDDGETHSDGFLVTGSRSREVERRFGCSNDGIERRLSVI